MSGLELVQKIAGSLFTILLNAVIVVVLVIFILIQREDLRDRVIRLLGASRLQLFWHVSLPLARRGIGSGVILAFARALGEFGATITFVSNIPGETQTIPTAIYMLLQEPGGDLAALRLTLVSIAISLAALIAAEPLMARAARRALGL